MKYLIIFPLFFISSGIYCQEDAKKGFHDEFNSFKTEITHEFDDFKKKNDSAFLKFLDDSWQEFELFKSEKESRPKPSTQPKISTLQIPEKNKIENIPEENNKQDEMDNNKGKPEQMAPAGLIDFYGTYIHKATDLPTVAGNNVASREGIHDFFELVSENESTNQYIWYIKEKAESLGLNDWGFIALLKKSAAGTSTNTNEQKLFIWYAMLINGYDVKLAYGENDVYLLFNTDYKLFNTSFFTLNNQRYYMLKFDNDPEDVSLLFSHRANYVDKPSKVSLAINKLPKFDEKAITKYFTFHGATYPVVLNRNLIDFYNEYPETDLSVYFSAPMSQGLSLSMTNFFSGILKGKTKRQKTDILLEYIQSSIKYQTDEKQFGHERYLFADETLFYPYSDCEDRAVLLAQLVKQFVGLSAIGLDYPKHISLAVAFPEKFDGYHITFIGKKYYICDPTYIGAKSGICMDGFKHITPTIIYYGQ